MTLSEIETILQELSVRHPHLTQELLTTLLVSAGWEEKTIKEAVVLFNQHGGVFTTPNPAPIQQAVLVPPPTSATLLVSETANLAEPMPVADITFYQPDGTEEGKLKAFDEVPIVQEKCLEKKIEAAEPLIKNPEPVVPNVELVVPEQMIVKEVVATEPQKITLTSEVPIVTAQIQQPVVVTPVPQTPPTMEPQSLITHDEVLEKRSIEKQGVLPGNLPLLPFESSPHIWSFAKYKDVFHSETKAQEEIKVITVMPQEEKVVEIVTKQPEIQPQTYVYKDIEVVLESLPLRKDDKPLVFLATIMLLAIILILGYMYSNGRL